jgi:hypothetical protein
MSEEQVLKKLGYCVAHSIEEAETLCEKLGSALSVAIPKSATPLKPAEIEVADGDDALECIALEWEIDSSKPVGIKVRY